MKKRQIQLISAGVALALSACGKTDHLGKPPSFSPAVESEEYNAMMSPGLPATTTVTRQIDMASLWSGWVNANISTLVN